VNLTIETSRLPILASTHTLHTYINSGEAYFITTESLYRHFLEHSYHLDTPPLMCYKNNYYLNTPILFETVSLQKPYEASILKKIGNML
jgi:hypothetical protein